MGSISHGDEGQQDWVWMKYDADRCKKGLKKQEIFSLQQKTKHERQTQSWEAAATQNVYCEKLFENEIKQTSVQKGSITPDPAWGKLIRPSDSPRPHSSLQTRSPEPLHGAMHKTNIAEEQRLPTDLGKRNRNVPRRQSRDNDKIPRPHNKPHNQKFPELFSPFPFRFFPLTF